MSGSRAGVFLDRDGTINEELNFITRPEQIVLLPGAGEAVRTLNELNLPTVVISNQSGVARGFLSEEDLSGIHARLREELARSGARLDRIMYCPHHPTEGKPPYNIACRCRKPQTGMLEDAAHELDIDLARSFVVGDRLADIEAAHNSGSRGILVLTGYGRLALTTLAIDTTITPDFIADDLSAAVSWISQSLSQESKPHD